MKLLTLLILILAAGSCFAQRVLNNCIITAQSEYESKGNRFNPGGIVKTISKIYLKDSMLRYEYVNTSYRSITITNNSSDATIHLFDTPYGKYGYTATKEEKQDLKRRMDTIQKRSDDENFRRGIKIKLIETGFFNSIEYVEDSKVINNINCKKAKVITKNSRGVRSKFSLWYSADFIMPDEVPSFGRGVHNKVKINGLPVQYKVIHSYWVGDVKQNSSTSYTLTSIEENVKFSGDEFQIPPSYIMKSYQDWIRENPAGNPSFLRQKADD